MNTRLVFIVSFALLTVGCVEEIGFNTTSTTTTTTTTIGTPDTIPVEESAFVLNEERTFGYKIKRERLGSDGHTREAYRLYGGKAKDNWREFLIDTYHPTYELLEYEGVRFKGDMLYFGKTVFPKTPRPLKHLRLSYNFSSDKLTDDL